MLTVTRDYTEGKFYMKFHQNCFLCHCNKLANTSLLELSDKFFRKADLLLVEASMFIG